MSRNHKLNRTLNFKEEYMNLSDIGLLLLAVVSGIITVLDILILSGKRGKKDEDEE